MNKSSSIKKGKWYVSVIQLFFIFFLITPCLNTYGAETFTSRVIKIIDGDTIVINHNRNRVVVRLWGIDTPEWGQTFSRKALLFSQKSVLNKLVVVQSKDWDDYGRLVATVKVGEKTLNQELVEAGLAWVHIYYCREAICTLWKNLEYEARQERKGLWYEKKPTPPWIWKRIKKK